MDVKKAFTSNDRLTILESCEFGEDAIQKAYIEALAADVDMDTEIRKLITGQKSALKADHDLIRIHRDANVNTSSS